MSDSHPSAASTEATPAHGHEVSPVAHDAGAHGAHDMHSGLYWGIGIALLALTGVTVALSYMDFGSHGRNVVIGMLVATFKVCMVGYVFMHLKGEKPTITRFLWFTLFFAAGLFLLTYLHWSDPIFGTHHNQH